MLISLSVCGVRKRKLWALQKLSPEFGGKVNSEGRILPHTSGVLGCLHQQRSLSVDRTPPSASNTKTIRLSRRRWDNWDA